MHADGWNLSGDKSRAFLDRELSWLDFNWRVLRQSANTSIPLLERVRFLAIHASNQDEFFQLRVSDVHEAALAGVTNRSTASYTPTDLLKEIRDVAGEQLRFATDLFNEDLRPALATEGIGLVEVADLDASSSEWVSQQFDEQIYPVLTPLAVDMARPFPYISDLSLNLVVLLRQDIHIPGQDEFSFARVKVPPILPRFMRLPGDTFVALEKIIAAYLPKIFPGVEIVGHSTFRVTRDADVEVDDTDGDNLMKLLEHELNQRRFGEPVRLEVDNNIDEDSLEMLTRELGLSHDAVMTAPELLALNDLAELYKVDRPDLKFERHVPRTNPALELDKTDAAGFFSAIKKRDVLLHFPYESFTDSVASFIHTAAHDPDVLAIKMTMYRTSERTQLVNWLVQAAELGKQVVVVVELKARFDEHANIEWARQLERAGVHVSYGLAGLKTHCKLALVVRREGRKGNQIQRYTHVGTGNYNADTARYYEDLGLLSADEALADDVSQLFNKLTGYSRNVDYNKMLVAPETLSAGLVDLIEEQASRGEDGYIFMKVNALVDTTIIESLYAASNAGCKIDLVVRGICCLVPGLVGVSENIRVRSVVGRFLEHSRIYRFGESRYWIGSPDPMPRNLLQRVEALVSVTGDACQAQLAALSAEYLRDDIEHWEMDASGQWQHLPGVSLHQRLANSNRAASPKQPA